MNPHLRRLYADEKHVKQVFGIHPNIKLIETKGEPPERYRFQFLLYGMVEDDDHKIVMKESHEVEIYLPVDYPRRPPFCRMMSPIYHPNINPQKICIGDHWSAGQSLDQLIIRIGEMICFQSYNVKSPLNAEAAVWAEQNIARLPLDETDLWACLD